MSWIIAFCVGGCISLGYWYSISYGLTELALAGKKPSSNPESPKTAAVSPSIQFGSNVDIRPPLLKPLKTDTLTLHMLFKNDFPQLWIQNVGTTITDSKAPRKIESQVYMDFPGRSRFIGFYIPGNTQTYEDCLMLPDVVEPLIAQVRKSVSVKAGTIGGSGTKFDDLVSTGRVYLYHESDLDLQERAEIEHVFAAKNLSVIFRGQDWLMFRLQALRKQTSDSSDHDFARLQWYRTNSLSQPDPLPLNKPLELQISVLNIGREQARQVFGATLIEVANTNDSNYQKLLVARFESAWEQSLANQRVAEPQGREVQPVNGELKDELGLNARGPIIDEETKQRILAQTRFVFLVAAMRYTDSRGEHELQSCRYLKPPFNDMKTWSAGAIHEGTIDIR